MATWHPDDERLMQYSDGELGLLRARRVRVHLAACVGCRARLDALQGVLSDAVVRGDWRDHDSPDAEAAIAGPRAMLRARLAEASSRMPARRSGQLWFARNLAYVCALALFVAIGIGVTKHQRKPMTEGEARLLPNPVITPGFTRAVSLGELCTADRDEVVRDVAAPVRQQVFAAYGIAGSPARDFEVDYLITPGLGGADDVRNLWPQPHSNMWNSYVKDQLEDHLHRMVCERQMPLDEAQRAIASDWIAAYKKYFNTDKPLIAPLEASLR